jgi:hypothetical protein
VRRARRDPRFRAAVAGRFGSPDWRERGLCLQQDPELFFPTVTDDPAPALAVCGVCPVRGACLAAALDCGECDGIWGATTAEERRPMRQAWASATQRPVARSAG